MIKIVNIPKDQGCIITPKRFKYSDGELISKQMLLNIITVSFKQQTGQELPITIRDMLDDYYYLYPQKLIEQARFTMPPMYTHPQMFTPDGIKIPDSHDCDNKSFEWIPSWYHYSLPSCPILRFVGTKPNSGHAYCGIITKERTIMWLNGEPKNLNVIRRIEV